MESVFWDNARARRREHTRRLAQLQQIYVYVIGSCFLIVCCAYIVWGDVATHSAWPTSAGHSLPRWVFSGWIWATIMGLHGGILFGVLAGPPVIVHAVTRKTFVWRVGVWWAAGFLCEAVAFATGAYATSSLALFRFSAAMLVAAACSFHVPVLGPKFKSLYRSYMITWVALDAATQNMQRSEAREGRRRPFSSSPNMAPAVEGDSPGHIALTTFAPSTSRPTNVAFAQNVGRVSPPPRQRTNNAGQRERASNFFRVHLQLALVTVATSVHASLLLAPAANVLLVAVDARVASSDTLQHDTTLRTVLLGVVLAAWAVAVCVRWNVTYGVAACCVILSLPVGRGLLSMVHNEANAPQTGAGEPLWSVLSRSPGLLLIVVCIAVTALAVVAVGDLLVNQLRVRLFPPPDEGNMGGSGHLGSEALEEPLARPVVSTLLLQGRHHAHSFHSFEMNALVDDDSELESL